jgi:hypothetical protein
MTAIELYYSSLPYTNRPYCEEDEDETELSELEIDAYLEHYSIFNKCSFNESY